MNDAIIGTDVSIRHASVIHCDLSSLHANVNKVSLDSSEPTVVQRSWVDWLG